MSQKQASAYCVHCDRRVLAIGTQVNHLLHLVLTFCTCGVWLFVWLLLVITNANDYRCTRCGTNV